MSYLRTVNAIHACLEVVAWHSPHLPALQGLTASHPISCRRNIPGELGMWLTFHGNGRHFEKLPIGSII